MPLPRTGRRALLTSLIAPLGLLLGARAAAAHAVVTTSEPAAGAVLATPPERVVVHFNSRIDHTRSRLTLIGPDGTQAVLDIAPPAEPALLEAPAPRLAPGTWRLRWQVLAVDGHITRGDIPFTIQTP